MKKIRLFNTLAEANAEGAKGLVSPHVDCIRGYASANFKKVDGDNFVCEFDNQGKIVAQKNNEIWYTSTDGNIINDFQYIAQDLNGNRITLSSNTYTNGKGVATYVADVKQIGSGGISNLKTISLPDSIEILNASFPYSNDLEAVRLPNNLKTIKTGCFSRCPKLHGITIPKSVERMEGNIGSDYGLIFTRDYFKKSDYINPCTYPDRYANNFGATLYDYDVDGFLISGTTLLKYEGTEAHPVIPDGITTIDGQAFAENALTAVTIPNTVTYIGWAAFGGCTGLTSIVIPNSVTKIDGYAFSYCTGLTSVTMSTAITEVVDYAFNECNNLPVENNIIYADTYLIGATDRTLSAYTIKEGTRIIGPAFGGCENLTGITFPDSVVDISTNAFSYCPNLPVENNVRYAGDCFAAGLSDYTLTTYTLKEGTKYIGNELFIGSSISGAFTIPNTVKKNWCTRFPKLYRINFSCYSRFCYIY